MDDKMGLELSALTSVDNQLLPELMLEQEGCAKDGWTAGSIGPAEDADDAPNYHAVNETCCVQQELRYLTR